ncbi:MAG TPA: hypothetical protein VGH27_23415 [Streptosporangiaceae bacterium]|jgi:hypothetical protein
MSQQWRQRRDELMPPGPSLPERLRRYALQALRNPRGPRLVAWSGLQYAGPDDDPDRAARARCSPQASTDCAAMAPTILPQIIETLSGADPRSEEFVGHFADQMALLAGCWASATKTIVNSPKITTTGNM